MIFIEALGALINKLIVIINEKILVMVCLVQL